MRALVGVDGLEVVNHEWWDDATFVAVGTLDADDVAGCPAAASPRRSTSGSTASSSRATSR